MFDVVIPLFNKEEFVEATVQSVVSQRYRDWRLFVVDDGSSDRGPDIVERFKDPRITLLRQANQGVGPARNAGIQQGSAEWIAFLDADDVWDEDHLEELDALRREFPDAVLIGCGFRRVSGASTAVQRRRAGRRRASRYFAESGRGRQPFFTSSASVRRSAIEAVGDFKALPGNEDVELWARLALHGPVANSTKQTVAYRLNTGGITDRGLAERIPPARVVRREELSSTIPTLSEALPGIRDPKLRREIVEYMDSRVGLSLVAAVRAGDLSRARYLLGLYESKPRGKARIAALLTKFPRFIVRPGIMGAVRLRRLVSRG